MILSKSNNFLLLKNQKVGGTSLEIPLSMVVPEDAIVTPRTSDDAAWALQEKIYDGYKPRNYDGFYNHMSYSEINAKIDLTDIKSYIFIRNPYDAVLSHFFHRLYFINKNDTWNNLDKIEQNVLVEKYFNNELGWSWHKSNKHIYLSSDGNIQVDNFLIYENGIESEINNILIQHGIPTISITQNEKAFRPKSIKPEDVFSYKYLDQIYKEWLWEFKTFGYNKI